MTEFTEEDYVKQLTDRAEVLGGLTAKAHQELHRQQRMLGRLEGLILVLLVVIGMFMFRMMDDIDVLDLRISRVEAQVNESS